MTTHDRVRLQLQALEALLREHQHWRNDEPQPHQFNSTQPFFMDTMEPLEWLQWVLIPRMHDLLDNKQPLCNQVNHLIPTRVLVKGGEITCKILK
ncbi:YqcC family protein [Escherichia coli]